MLQNAIKAVAKARRTGEKYVRVYCGKDQCGHKYWKWFTVDGLEREFQSIERRGQEAK